MVWQYCDRGLESRTRNINCLLLGIHSARCGEGSGRIAHSYRNDSKTIFLYGGDFLLWAELADPNADLGQLIHSGIPRMPASNPRLGSGDEDDGNSYIETRANGLAFQMTGVCRGRDNTMNKSLIDSVRHEEETLGDELPDVVLEVAGSKGWEQAGNSFTLAFCTGLDTCPSMRE
jgi:hypothetical protein